MTLSVQTVRQLYNGNGSTTSFAIPFSFETNDEVEVILVDSDDVETVQSYTTHYTISGSNVSMVTAPAAGEKLLIRMDVDLDQETDLSDQSPFLPSSLEGELDEIVAQVQMLNERINRCLTLPKSSALTLVEFPRSFTDKAGYVPSVTDAETGFEFVVTTGQITSAAASATAAASSASSAASSATSASSSATSAAASATAAAASATAAAASAASAGTPTKNSTYDATITGDLDGVNTDFVCDDTFAVGDEVVTVGVQTLNRDEHYTFDGTNLSLTAAPEAGQNVTVRGKKVS